MKGASAFRKRLAIRLMVGLFVTLLAVAVTWKFAPRAALVRIGGPGGAGPASRSPTRDAEQVHRSSLQGAETIQAPERLLAPMDRTSDRSTKQIPEDVFSEICNVFLRAAQAAHPGGDLGDKWRDAMVHNFRWNEESNCWDCGFIKVEPPGMILKSYGGIRGSNMPQSVAKAELDSWLERQVAEGKAISLDRAREIAEEFARRFVPDWDARNYRLAECRWAIREPGSATSDLVDSGRYEMRFVQAPYQELGEVLVTEAPIDIDVDPWTSEIMRFVRNVVGGRRIEPRIAFTGPLIDEAAAIRIFENHMGLSISGPNASVKVVKLRFELRVDVTWDEHGIPTGRPVWQSDVGLQAVVRDDSGNPVSGGIAVVRKLQIDARSGEIVAFR